MKEEVGSKQCASSQRGETTHPHSTRDNEGELFVLNHQKKKVCTQSYSRWFRRCFLKGEVGSKRCEPSQRGETTHPHSTRDNEGGLCILNHQKKKVCSPSSLRWFTVH